ncbi:MAG: hypothetical protein KDC67_17720, partial [Ignavibacteriae bacterium]|nr:hypothetical protein [Ignavibacteriota bacterium]
MKLPYVINVLILFIFFYSCAGENAGQLDSMIDSQFDDGKKIDCPDVNFHEKLFDKHNIITLFNCFGWNEEYQSIYAFIDQLPSEYSTFAKKLNTNLSSNKTKRDEWIQILSLAS